MCTDLLPAFTCSRGTLHTATACLNRLWYNGCLNAAVLLVLRRYDTRAVQQCWPPQCLGVYSTMHESRSALARAWRCTMALRAEQYGPTVSETLATCTPHRQARLYLSTGLGFGDVESEVGTWTTTSPCSRYGHGEFERFISLYLRRRATVAPTDGHLRHLAS